MLFSTFYIITLYYKYCLHIYILMLKVFFTQYIYCRLKKNIFHIFLKFCLKIYIHKGLYYLVNGIFTHFILWCPRYFPCSRSGADLKHVSHIVFLSMVLAGHLPWVDVGHYNVLLDIFNCWHILNYFTTVFSWFSTFYNWLLLFSCIVIN